MGDIRRVGIDMSFIIKGLTVYEKEKIKAIQRATNSYPDGIPGPQFLDNVYRLHADVKYPYSEKFFNTYIIFGKLNKLKFVDVKNSKTVKYFNYSMSGTFQWDNKVSSILVSDGKVINDSACHAWLGYPESVLYYTKDGRYGVKQVMYANQLPENILWAIGGFGLEKYDTIGEGFCEVKLPNGKTVNYGDVLRTTSHVGIGITQDDYVCLFLKPNCHMTYFRELAIEKLNLKCVVALDGGHIPAINTPRYQYNEKQKQRNIMTF